MIRIRDEASGHLTIEASGRLSEQDYEALVPRLEQEIARRGGLRLLVLLRDFEGWTPGALWRDLRFDLRHRKDFEREAEARAWLAQVIPDTASAPVH